MSESTSGPVHSQKTGTSPAVDLLSMMNPPATDLEKVYFIYDLPIPDLYTDMSFYNWVGEIRHRNITLPIPSDWPSDWATTLPMYLGNGQVRPGSITVKRPAYETQEKLDYGSIYSGILGTITAPVTNVFSGIRPGSDPRTWGPKKGEDPMTWGPRNGSNKPGSNIKMAISAALNTIDRVRDDPELSERIFSTLASVLGPVLQPISNIKRALIDPEITYKPMAAKKLPGTKPGTKIASRVVKGGAYPMSAMPVRSLTATEEDDGEGYSGNYRPGSVGVSYGPPSTQGLKNGTLGVRPAPGTKAVPGTKTGPGTGPGTMIQGGIIPRKPAPGVPPGMVAVQGPSTLMKLVTNFEKIVANTDNMASINENVSSLNENVKALLEISQQTNPALAANTSANTAQEGGRRRRRQTKGKRKGRGRTRR